MEEVVADASIPVDRDADELNSEPSISLISDLKISQWRGF